jgi:hypothetical protein
MKFRFEQFLQPAIEGQKVLKIALLRKKGTFTYEERPVVQGEEGEVVVLPKRGIWQFVMEYPVCWAIGS